ncbi:e9ace0ac-dd26-4b35-b68d-f03de30a661a [Sclerotinia trifoliorum]|uniref:E9ace0ac-dd26-4b35-b68d-f03de30a661a n=1 Tax=Sclerotinia trifoliorum TaxID=28548 RepID=A0A8H2W108_9HELO|nr:e9ace0ac-dd26-4b35-b68d-f03de30a661a [Sclerotinia trifoliorum]
MENPVLIQKAARRYKSAIPLFLFHDGGGTVLPYYFLESLNRNVWGISYPHLNDGGIFEDGIKGMGELYAGMIRGKVSRGKVLLGGWSAGGSVAIQVAKCLENIPEICVAGTILLDTPFPDFPDWRPKDEPPVQFHLPVAPDQTAQNRLAQQQAVNDIIHALSVWELPIWEDGRRPPPAVFIRALEAVSTENVVEVDWFRGEYALGWRKYPYEFIIQELRVHGDHFSIFTPLYLPELSTKLREACELLDSKQEYSMLLDSKHSSTILVKALKSF